MKARLVRALGLDGNPLRRASDRAEAWIRAGLLIIFLTAGPIAALAVGQLGESATAAVLASAATLAAMALALLIVLRLIQRFLSRRRLAAWEAAWRATGPRWTGRRS
ncbi:MAG TPA: hypothetical protein VFE59_30965 [Trebonia sp.]|jgi:small-conductance mechanosensitive channel|nr:hypothetical protein [Trebonia sp.]